MPDDRRSARRVRLSGVRVTYESSTGTVQQADVANLSREGVFITTATPVQVGKRLALEIQVAGEAAPWAALGRVVWNRAVAEGADIPGGMAVKFIDVDDAVVAAIDRLIEARERTEPGLGERDAASARRGDPRREEPRREEPRREEPRREEPRREEPRREPPRRERTMLGVGIAASSPAAKAGTTAPNAPAPAAPVARVLVVPADPPAPAQAARALPSREKTMVGVGLGGAGADPREPSLPIDLVAKKPPSTRPPPAASEPPPAPAADIPTSTAIEDVPTPSATESASASTATEDAPRTPSRSEATPMPARSARDLEAPEETSDRFVSEPPAPKRGSGGRWLLLLLLIAGGASGYVFRDRLLPFWYVAVNAITKRLR
jgi:uncharacterized protein (TIGR02266 family)